MTTDTAKHEPLDIVALGWALSAALLVLYVLCLLVALIFPNWTATHAWIGLFSTAPLNSLRVWIDGLVFNLLFGWLTALILGTVYNRLIHR